MSSETTSAETPAGAADGGPKRTSPNRALAPLKAAALLSSLYFLAKLTGLFKQQILGANLPTYATDAYTAAFRLTDFVNYLIAGGALSITFIPIFTELRESNREKEAWRFFSSLFSLLALLSLLLVGVCVLFAEPLMRFFASGLDDASHPPGTFELSVRMAQIILPGQIFFVLGGLVVGALNAQKRFGATGFTGAAYNMGTIVVSVVLFWLTGNPVVFAIGTLSGAFLGYFVLPLWAAMGGPRDLRPCWSFSFQWRDPLIKQYFLTALPIMLGVSFPVVDQILVGKFASHLQGGLTHLDFGNRLMIVAQSLLAQAASVAAFPYLASDSAAQNWSKLAEFLRQGLRRLMFIALPISTWMILTARPTVDLVYGWGKYNNFQALHNTSVAYAFYSAGLFAWAGQQLVARGFYALKDTKTPTIIGSVITVVFFIPLLYVCARSTHAVLLLALATSIGACVHFAAMTIALERKLAAAPYNVQLGTHRVCGTLLRTACACALMGLAGLLVSKGFDALHLHGKLASLLRLTLISAVAWVVFCLAAQRFAIPEYAWLAKRIGPKLKKLTRR